MPTLTEPRLPLWDPRGYEPNLLASEAGRAQASIPEIPVGLVRQTIGSLTARFNLFGNSGSSTPQRTPPATP
eukprot:5312543-Amphidinium_carterae.1